MALVFAVIHLYTIFNFLLLLSIPFLYFFNNFLYINLAFINRRNEPRGFNRGNTDGTNFSKILCLTFVYFFSFYVGQCRD